MGEWSVLHFLMSTMTSLVSFMFSVRLFAGQFVDLVPAMHIYPLLKLGVIMYSKWICNRTNSHVKIIFIISSHFTTTIKNVFISVQTIHASSLLGTSG